MKDWLLNGIRLSGALQGLILAVAIFSKRKLKANRFLGTFLLLFAVHLGVLTIYNQETLLAFPYLIIFTDALPFLYGPLVYHYLYHLLFREYRPKIPLSWQLLPVPVDIIIYSSLFIHLSREELVLITTAVFTGEAPWFVLAIDSAKFLSGIIYSVLIIRLFQKNRKLIGKWSSSENHKRWLWTLITGFVLCWVPALLAAATQYFPQRLNASALNIYQAAQSLCFTAFFYILSIFTIKFPALLSPGIVREEIRKKLNLTEKDIESVTKALKKELEDGIYKDPELTLKSAAEHLGIHPNILSFIINEYFNKNFKELINRHRVDEFKKLCFSGRLARETVLSLALDSGFNSKSSFNRIFKEICGETPSEFLSAHLQQ